MALQIHPLLLLYNRLQIHQALNPLLLKEHRLLLFFFFYFFFFGLWVFFLLCFNIFSNANEDIYIVSDVSSKGIPAFTFIPPKPPKPNYYSC